MSSAEISKYYDHAFEFYAKKEWKHAIIALEKLLNLVPSDINSLINISLCYYEINEINKTIYYL